MRTLLPTLIIVFLLACDTGVDKNRPSPEPAVGRTSGTDTTTTSSPNRLPRDSSGKPDYQPDSTAR